MPSNTRHNLPQKPKKYIKYITWIAGVFFLLILIGGTIAYFKREALLKAAITRVINKAQRDYQLKLMIDNARFTGLSTVSLDKVSVIPNERDSLLLLNNLKVGVKIFPLILGDIKLSEFSLDNGWLSLVKKDSTSNYDFLFKKKNVDEPETKKKIDLAEFADKILNEALYKIPDDLDLKNFDIRFKDDDTQFSIYTKTATIDDGKLNSTILINKDEAVWHVDGQVDPSDRKIDVKLFADNKKVELAYLEKKYNLKLNFDTVKTRIDKVVNEGGELKIYGFWAVKNLLINQERIAANDIIVKDGSIDANMFIGENYVSIDSSSVIHLGKINANPFIKYTLNPVKIYELKMQMKEQNAQEVFNAFPVGLFESLDGIKVAGNLSYNLNFYLNTKQPDSVQFDSGLTGSNGFKILSYGKTDLRKINSTFTHTPYERGKPVRPIIIGPQNPNFVTLNQVSVDLRNALLTAEDPSFYTHKGFVEQSFRNSIATNYKAKSFVRGGSTISMQLVKNIYLSRQKNIARKIEEILIVWLMENERINTKSRMLEVYLNAIEWGRNIYGITEASRYYFAKSPSELSLGEAIYLASIVPKPKSALYAFQADGSLKPYLRGYFKLIGNIMARKGLTSRDTNAYGFYGVRLREGLRQTVLPDSVPDSLLILEGDGGLFDFKPANDVDTSKIEKFFNKIFKPKPTVKDSVEKTPAQIRRERREQRRRERENLQN